jgi:hypothetical protein
MFGWGKPKINNADRAIQSLGDALLALQVGSELAFYAEANAATVNIIILEKAADSAFHCYIPSQDFATHVREIWTQFRLLDRQMWHAFDLTLLGEGGRHTTFFYPPIFDESVGFERRARRWARFRFGKLGLNAMIEREKDIIEDV